MTRAQRKEFYVRHVRLLTMAALLAVAALMTISPLGARQAAPGAPANLVIVTSPGGGVSLQWTHSTGTFTHYIIEAGGAPGAPFLRIATDAFRNGSATTNGYYGKLPDLVAAFSAAGIGDGDYYVRIRGANGAAESAPSNEVIAHIRAGCYFPGTPTDFTAIMRDTFGMLQWNPGDGGAATTYLLYASTVPNLPSPQFVIPLGTPNLTVGVPGGTWYVRIAAANACGQSAPSAEYTLTSPSNSPARTPDPAPGARLPQPNAAALVAQFGAEATALGYLQTSQSCPQRPGTNPFDELEARKTTLNPFINYIVDKLRLYDTRFGYNAKPTRAWTPAIIAGDEIAYHYGSDPQEGSPNAYAVDVLFGHCTGAIGSPREAVGYRTFYDEFVRWTGAGRF